jgi:hypothetical protein
MLGRILTISFMLSLIVLAAVVTCVIAYFSQFGTLSAFISVFSSSVFLIIYTVIGRKLLAKIC